MKLSVRGTAPFAAISVAIAITTAMFYSHPEVERIVTPVVAPLVETVVAYPRSVEMYAVVQGTVLPRTEIDLVAEVGGRVFWVSPQFASGGFFSESEALVRIDARDYELTVESARAKLARSRSDLVHANAALKRQRSMRATGASSEKLVDDAFHAAAVAEAGVREANAALGRAELDLERTEIHGPFAGRVKEKHIDVGQFVARGSPVARIYAVDYAEVRLPIADEDAAILDLPLGYRDAPMTAPRAEDVPEGTVEGEIGGETPVAGELESAPAPAAEDPTADVLLSTEIGGRRYQWTGRIVRTEGSLDPRTRMMTAVARIEDPYARGADVDRPPLTMGLFVDAEIRGRTIDDLVELPRSALRERDGAVVVVDDEQRLRLRRVEVFRSERERVWIGAGLAPGERVVTTPLDIFVEGSVVRSATIEAPDGRAAAEEVGGEDQGT